MPRTSSTVGKTIAKTTTTKKTPTATKKTITKKSQNIQHMSNSNILLIVESPTKAKTISKFLKGQYDVIASMGHITELADKNMSKLVQNNFEPDYVVAEGKNKVMGDLKKLVKNHEEIIIATDEDREGEAIGRHLCRQLKLDPEKTKRIVFHEITSDAISHAISHPRNIDMSLVSAQKSRAVLDRLVGFSISPVLRAKVKQGLSAGRVQSVAMKLVVEKEKQIQNFKAQEYWTMQADLQISKKIILPIYLKKVDSNIEDQESMQDADDISKDKTTENEEESLKLNGSRFTKNTINQVWSELNISTADLQITKDKSNYITYTYNKPQSFQLINISSKDSSKNPPMPFVTSTLQQTASRMFGWSVKTVMSAAQKLYENGMITYMRTDSPNISTQAIDQISTYINHNFGKDYIQTRQYKSKSKNAQEAHECIRPTDIQRGPGSISIGAYESKLYDLIRRRTVASQMSTARYTNTTYSFAPVL